MGVDGRVEIVCIVGGTATGWAGAAAMMTDKGVETVATDARGVLPCIKPRALVGASVSFAETHRHFQVITALQYELFLILSL